MCRLHHAVIVWILVVSMTLSPSVVFAQDAEQSTDAVTPSIGYIPPTAFAAAIAFPHRVLASPTFELAPTEVISAAGLKEWGIDPMNIEQVIGVAEPPLAGPPAMGVVLIMTKPVGDQKIFPQLVEKTESAELDGQKYQKGKTPMDLSIYCKDKTIIVAHDAILRKMLANNAKPQEGQISKVLAHFATPPDIMAMVWLEPVRPMIAASLAQSQNTPQFADLNKAPDLISTIGLKANLAENVDFALTIHANSEADAEKLGKIIDQTLMMAKQMSMMSAAAKAMSDDPIEKAQAKYSARLADHMTKAWRPVRKGKNLTLTANLSQNIQTQVAAFSIMSFLLLPAVQSARTAAQRVQAEKTKAGDQKLQPEQP